MVDLSILAEHFYIDDTGTAADSDVVSPDKTIWLYKFMLLTTFKIMLPN